ncbi:MAG: hypothetical protein HQM09_05875 [Candidatus Riflebacteria bacterium]|nr:hypothetical protein [Candidatus Riflebacteria bacterium]
MSMFLKDRFCNGCGATAQETNHFCRSCGFEIADVDSDTDQVIFFPPPGSVSSEAGGPWLLILIVIGILMVVSSIAYPGFGKAREEARKKACYANMRVLLGAVEMYNMDHSVMVNKISDSDAMNNGFLVNEKYLKAPLSHVEISCSYYSIGDLSTDKGRISCVIHGTVEE